MSALRSQSQFNIDLCNCGGDSNILNHKSCINLPSSHSQRLCWLLTMGQRYAMNLLDDLTLALTYVNGSMVALGRISQ